jgi:L-alanine-DL-glutamate epimerase-like enolase superfamily enzyme
LHDWDDASAIRILNAIGRAADPSARLLLLELVVPEDDVPHTAKIIDLTIMVTVGGRERTESQWRRLLAEGGFTVDRVIGGSGMYSAIEATRNPPA